MEKINKAFEALMSMYFVAKHSKKQIIDGAAISNGVWFNHSRIENGVRFRHAKLPNCLALAFYDIKDGVGGILYLTEEAVIPVAMSTLEMEQFFSAAEKVVSLDENKASLDKSVIFIGGKNEYSQVGKN